MTCSPCVRLALLLASALCASVSLAAEVPPETFSIDNATVGVTTLTDVQRIYGAAEASRVGREDGADVRICYTHPSSKGRTFLIFESGVMGGFKQITGFRLSTIRPSGNCVSTKTDIDTLETRNRVRLGQNLADFKKAIPVEFKRRGSELIYEAVNQRAADYEAARRRAATQEEMNEELKRLRAKWPNEQQDHFDVTMTLSAKFKDDRLIDFYVHKIESN
jgi:hypothetical protein